MEPKYKKQQYHILRSYTLKINSLGHGQCSIVVGRCIGRRCGGC